MSDTNKTPSYNPGMTNGEHYLDKKVYAKYCTNCKVFLLGDGSYIMPYQCNCGVYEYSPTDGKYKIVPQKESKK